MKPSDASEETIFDAARQMPDPQARASYLNAACAGNPILRQRIEDLLKAGLQADQFLAGDPLELGAAGRQTILVGPLSEGPGTVIGNYKLLEKLGEGGFGVVYMAEQKQPVKRRVALKIIKVGMDTREVVARFEAERQALAILDHPNIAKVFDAGATDAPHLLPSSRSPLPSDGRGIKGEGAEGMAAPSLPSSLSPLPSVLPAGRPYFVMELVRGIKITDYCDQTNLPTRERLDLFMQVCQAVQHAHQKGIIHRDLKPSNILVTVNDGVAVPKIIDFGIAKATQMELTEKTVFTRFQQFLGTPAYMSPEQAEITSVDIDTRSDIYSLGVLLYELLTGKTPFDAKELLQAGLDEMRRTLREKEPERPSTRVSTLGGEELTTTAKRRGLEPPKLVNLLRGDLDWIVMKCLEKDRARRYETANGLAADVQRHLQNEPVVACPPSSAYRFQKLVRRNKVAFVGTSCVAAALVLGLCGATWGLVRERAAHKRAVAAEQEQARLRQQAQANEEKAQTAAATSQQVVQFFEEMLEGVGPEVAKGRDATILKEILDKTVQRLGTELTNQPAIESDMRDAVSKVYRALGDYGDAEVMLRRVVALERVNYPNGHRNLAKVLDDLAVTLMLRGNLPEAEALDREAIAMGEKFLGPVHTDVAAWLNNLANILKHEGNLKDAEAMYREGLAMNRKLLGNGHREVAVSLNNLATLVAKQGKLSEAETLEREGLQIATNLWGNEDPMTARFLTSLTWILSHEDKLPEAETAGRDALAVQEKLLGPMHPDVANALFNLADVVEHQGELQEAEAMQRRALAIRRKSLGSEHPIVGQSLWKLGVLLSSRGSLHEAEATLREALALARKLPVNDYANPTNIIADLNKVLAAEGKPSEASPVRDQTQADKDVKSNR